MNEYASLPPGIYELLVDGSLDALIADLDESGFADVQPVDIADFPSRAAHHIGKKVESALEQVATEDRVALANRVLRALQDEGDALQLNSDRRELKSVFLDSPASRPLTPLTETALLTNASGTPSLQSELRLEMESADRVDLLCAFVKWTGITVLEQSLERLQKRGVPIRVLTTTYIGATDRKALDRLVNDFGAEVRVNYDSRTTHLHAKAWLFYRKTGFDTGYVGSSNLSRTALVDGLEWNVRVSRKATKSLMDNFDATFESYWASNQFAEYIPSRDAKRLDGSLAAARNGCGRSSSTTSSGITTHFLDVRPYPHQIEMLEELSSERSEQARTRNLVVAATGTGKTIVAALDYERLLKQARDLARAQGRANGPLRVLFVAHRKEILEQALETYRSVLKRGDFGALLIGGQPADDPDHVFASVQTLSRDHQLERWSSDHFDVVVIDEFHHAEARTYRKILDWFKPKQLLGLTATPERADGVNVAQAFFDGRVASELRLWDALDADLLVPFHYFGISDNVDLRRVTFRAGGYDSAELSKLYTGNDNRAALILRQLKEKVLDPQAMRALGFCASVDHAIYMAGVFTEAGIASVSLSGYSTAEEREMALQRLRAGSLQCIFTVDLFNEGVDVPEVDTVLMLRPTQSATVFLQQLGRGLRRARGKALLTVLDFVGHQHAKFRFDIPLRAMTGIPRGRLEDAVQKGFPQMPGGSQIVLDRVAQKHVLESIKNQLSLTTKALVSDIRQHRPKETSPIEYQLGDYLGQSGRDLPDIYKPNNRTLGGLKLPATWSAVRHLAFSDSQSSAVEQMLASQIMNRVRALTHVDDLTRAAAYRRLLAVGPTSRQEVSDDPYAAMLYYTFWPKGDGGSINEGLDEIRSNDYLCQELDQLLSVTTASSRSNPRTLEGDLGKLPLRTHARYSREELLAAFGMGIFEKPQPGNFREGVKWFKDHQTDVLLITLRKSEADFSPSTLYKDYALTPELFHWESQSGTSVESPTGQRYIHHREQGSRILLFVRQSKSDDLGTSPYTCLGTAEYESHEGSRPIQIVWKLDRPMPTDLFLEAKAVS